MKHVSITPIENKKQSMQWLVPSKEIQEDAISREDDAC
jgi:hypothetical protein